MAAATPPTYARLCTTLSTFLTVAIHTILYNRACYPASSFLLARAYNHPVRQSRHPAVCAWVTDAVDAVHAELLAGTLSRVALVICDAHNAAPLERFIFELDRLPRVPRTEVETPFAGADDGNPPDKENVDVSESLRAVLAKLTTVSARLGPIPRGCPFTLAMELKDDGDVDPPLDHPQRWIPATPGLQKTRLNYGEEGSGEASAEASRPVRLGQDLGGSRTVPIRSVDAGELVFEMWAEEGAAKANLGCGTSTSPEESRLGSSSLPMA